MQQTRLSVLGPPLVERNGAQIKLDTRRTLALLIYLAVTGRSHRRESLIALLWPESGRNSGRTSLRNALHTLRQALGGGNPLASDREMVGLARDSCIAVDVLEFRELVDQCKSHDHVSQEECTDCIEPLRAAVNLYRDDFLSGFALKDSLGFDDWQQAQTESLRSAVEYALDHLICAMRDVDVSQAIKFARRWLEVDRASETAHRYLMELFAESGQRTAALRQYEECTRVLTQELDAKPEGRTSRLFEEIRAGKFSTEAPAQSKPIYPCSRQSSSGAGLN